MAQKKLSRDKAVEALLALKQHGTKAAAARALNLPGATYDSRLKSAKRNYPHVVSQIMSGQEPTPDPTAQIPAPSDSTKLELSKIEAKAIYELWRGVGFNKSEMARTLGCSGHAVQHRLDILKKEYGLDPTPKEIAEARAKERSVADDILLLRAQESAKQDQARYKEARQQLVALEDRLASFELVANTSAKPAEWTMKPSAPGETREHIPHLFTSDFQIGEAIRPEETEHGYGYDTPTFRKRYRKMIETTIKLSFEHSGRNWVYPGIIYARGGDTVSGGIHEELAETDDVSPIEAVEIAFEEEAAGIRELLKAFGKVDVKGCGGGNHDRTTHKPRTKGAHLNYDKLVEYMLRREFKDNANVTFQSTESMDVYYPIYDKRILQTHGDRIGSRGGQGFIGPAATIMRGAQKVIMEQAALGRHVDTVMMGHFHVPMWLEWVLVNGSLPGYSEFAKSHRMRPSDPQQMLTYWYEGRGIVDLKPIKLLEV